MPPRGFLKANPRPHPRPDPRTQGHQNTSTQAHQYISTPVHQHTTLFHSYSTSTSVNDLHSHSAWQRNSWTLLAFIFLDYSVFTAYSISWICLKIKMQSLLQWIEGLRDYKWNVSKHLFYTSSKISKAAKLGLVGRQFGGRRPQFFFLLKGLSLAGRAWYQSACIKQVI